MGSIVNFILNVWLLMLRQHRRVAIKQMHSTRAGDPLSAAEAYIAFIFVEFINPSISLGTDRAVQRARVDVLSPESVPLLIAFYYTIWQPIRQRVGGNRRSARWMDGVRRRA